MNISDAIYSVVLSPALSGLARAFYQPYACSIAIGGEELLHLWCAHVDDSHFAYLRVDAFKPGDERTQALRVPHSLVLAIHGAPAAEAQIGFVVGEALQGTH
jgi:hypothetical protein